MIRSSDPSPVAARSPATALVMARQFLGTAAPLTVAPWGNGLINATWRVAVTGEPCAGRYILQRINPAVFPDPAGIMDNLARLHRLLAARPDAGLRLPRVFEDPTGAALVRDAGGAPWRLLEFIEHSRVLTAVTNAAQAREIGRVLGTLHGLAAGAASAGFTITLPGFHATPGYLAALDAIANADATAGNDPRVATALAAIDARRALVPVLEDARRNGVLPLRVIHGDPKIDNLLFADDADRALCLIDPDTIQPGLIHHDLGDCLRSCCNWRGESPTVATAVHFDLDLAAAILDGYATASGNLLSDQEVALLYPAIRLLPLELAIRFLTDHLAGDRYFRVGWRGQNLAKAAVQLALVAEIEANEATLRRIIEAAFARRRP